MRDREGVNEWEREWERERVRERESEREKEWERERERGREEKRREEKRREERNEDRRKSKGGIFRVRSTSMRATFFTSQSLNVLLQPFVAIEFERTKKNPERARKKSLRKSLYPPYENRLFTSTPVLPVALLTPCVVAPREKSSRRARMEQRLSYSLLKIELSSLPHITSYKVFHLPNETKIQKSWQGMLAHFFLTPLNLSVTQTCSAKRRSRLKAHARRRHKTNTVHSLFRVFLLAILLKSTCTDRKIAEFIVNSSRRRHVARKEFSLHAPSMSRERTSSFRVLNKVDFDVLVRRWKFFQDAREACEFSKNFQVFLPWTLAWHRRDRPHSAVAVWRTWRQTTDPEVEKEKHTSRAPSSRTTCFMYLTLAGRKKRPAKWRHRRRSGTFEGVAVQGRRLSRRSGPLRLEIAG